MSEWLERMFIWVFGGRLALVAQVLSFLFSIATLVLSLDGIPHSVFTTTIYQNIFYIATISMGLKYYCNGDLLAFYSEGLDK